MKTSVKKTCLQLLVLFDKTVIYLFFKRHCHYQKVLLYVILTKNTKANTKFSPSGKSTQSWLPWLPNLASQRLR